MMTTPALIAIVLASLLGLAWGLSWLSHWRARKAGRIVDSLGDASLSRWIARLRNPRDRQATIDRLCEYVDTGGIMEKMLALQLLAHEPPRDAKEVATVLPLLRRAFSAGGGTERRIWVGVAVVLREMGPHGAAADVELLSALESSNAAEFLPVACEALEAFGAKNDRYVRTVQKLLDRIPGDDEPRAAARAAAKRALRTWGCGS